MHLQAKAGLSIFTLEDVIKALALAKSLSKPMDQQFADSINYRISFIGRKLDRMQKLILP